MKLGAVIPVRLGSERFPKKHLQEIQGKSILLHLLDRIFASRYLTRDNVIICTTLEPEDDQLIPLVEQTGAKVFRGDRDDIIKRFHSAICHYQFDFIAQIDGDDPCIDTGYLDLCFEKILQDESLDIVLPTGLPLGIACKVFTKKALDKVYEVYCTTKNDTGFMWYFTKTGLCKVLEIPPVSSDDIHHEARLTLDYAEDLEFFKALFARLYTPEKLFNVRDMVALFKREPELIKINSALNEKFTERTKELAKLFFKVNGQIIAVE